jgi:hypothetical protein
MTILARRLFRFMLAAMFELTRREQLVVAGFLLVFTLGLGVKQWRETLPRETGSAIKVSPSH